MSAAGPDSVLEELWSPIAALTAAHDRHANGLITSTAVTASLVPESPRIAVLLGREHRTHELVLASGAFAIHLLPADPVGRSLEIFRTLGFRSGRDVDKLAGIPWRPGATGAPLLEDALAHVEGRVVRTLDAEDVTVFLADVVAEARVRAGRHLTIEDVRRHLTPDDWAVWEARLAEEIRQARRLRRA